MQSLLQDIRYGIRSLSKRPSFVVIAVITLGLGIGANTAIFSVVNAVLLKPLPFKDPERIVLLWGFVPKYAQTSDKLPTSAPNYLALAKETRSFEHLSAFRQWSWQLTGGLEPEQLQGARVSASFFDTIGASPMLGRPFTAEEDVPNRAPVAVISYGLWQRHFGSDQNIVGRTMTLSGQTVTVVGVMPPGFRFPGGANLIPGLQFAFQNDVWIPLALTDDEIARQGNLNLALAGRLKAGVSTAQAKLEINSIQSGLPLGTVGYSLNLVPLYQQMSGGVRRLMLVLFATVAFVLLIACANVANLLLTRATSRRREIAIRVALGAGRLRVVRQLLTESVLLSLLGGTIGIFLASWGISFLVALIPRDVPRIQEVGIDLRILAFGLVISFITGIIFGLVPALQSSKVDLNESLKEGSRGVSSGTRQNRIRSVLVVSEVSLAVVLLIGATLLTRSFIQLLKTNPGLDTSHVLKLEVALPNVPPSRYANESEQVSFFRQLIDRVSTVPGVEATAGVVTLPLTGAFESTDIIIEGRATDDAARPQANYNTITPDYFKVFRIPLLKGRQFTAQDGADSSAVIIVNDVLAKRLWPNEEVIGKRLRVGFETEPREIVGVVGTTKQGDLISKPEPEMYLPHSQFPNGTLTLIVRTHDDPLAMAPVIREHVRLQDRDIPVSRVGTMDQVLTASVAQQRFTMLLMGLFAGLALVLALVGIYAVMSYLVTQRSHEIGIRLALGAKMNDVLRLMLKTGLSLTLAGIAIGLAAAWALTRLMSSLLFGVTATDAMTFAGVPLLLIFVALVACYIPARRATKVDPLVALRHE